MTDLRSLAVALALSGVIRAQPAPVPTPAIESSPVPAPPVVKVTSHPRFLVARGESLRFPSTAASTPPTSEFCRFEKKAGLWFVTGLAPGTASFDWEKDHWEILVRERALKLPEKLSLSVFGDYPGPEALLHWARDFLHPRAELKLTNGQLQARGTDLIAYEGSPKLEVKSEPLEGRKADGLILSNWPEKIDSDQILLEAPLTPEKAWRVMVHHRNMPEQPARWLEIEIIQPPGVDERYAISSYLNGPATDEIFVGHLAALRYFKESSPRGYFASLAGGKRHLVERAWLKPGQTVSAMLSLRALLPRSQAGILRISARTPDNSESLSLRPTEAGARTARGVFPGEIVRELTYRAGPAYLFEGIGGQPYLSETTNGSPSPGNFGAVYRYRWKLENPGDQPVEVRMEMSARGGPARASLWIDGENIETGLLKAEAILLKRWQLPAGGTRDVVMETFPQAGSNFPLSVTLSTRSPGSAGDTPPPPALPSYYIP
ncbi:hypothetical protein JST97_24825 [bacterium]|nr:hypothetical protein [bacterium]